jgi:hypothetical protein
MLEHNPILNSYLGQNEHQLPFPGDANNLDFSSKIDGGGLFSPPQFDFQSLENFHKPEASDLFPVQHLLSDKLNQTSSEILGDRLKDMIGDKQPNVDDFLPNPHQPIPPFFKDSLPEDISLESPFTEDKNTPPMIPAKQILDSLAFDDSNLEGLPKPKTNINT